MAPLLQRLSPFTLSAPTIALLVWEIFIAALAGGLMALALSVYSKTSGLALVLSSAGFLLSLAVTVILIWVTPASGPLTVLLWNGAVGLSAYLLALRGLR